MIHEAAQKAILKDKNVRAALGNDIICEQPFSSSMNSMEANGKQLKMITLVFEVSGTVSSGRGNVSAEIGKDGLVKLKSLAITLAGGRQISVNVGNKPAPTIIDV